MPDQAALEAGFEAGTVAACNAILGWLNRNQMAAVATAVLLAWEDGSIAEVAGMQAAPSRMVDAAHPVPPLNREQARHAGYTGDQCSSCGGIRVKRNGSCTVCDECGQTTGCS